MEPHRGDFCDDPSDRRHPGISTFKKILRPVRMETGAVVNVGHEVGHERGSRGPAHLRLGAMGDDSNRQLFQPVPAQRIPEPWSSLAQLRGLVVKDKAILLRAYEGQRYNVGKLL